MLAALLIGTDYKEGIPKVGPVSAVKLVKQQKALENISTLTANETAELGIFLRN